jgi:ribonuclease R
MVWKNGHLFGSAFFAYEEAQYIIETKDDTIQKKFRLLELHQVSAEIVAATLKMDE